MSQEYENVQSTSHNSEYDGNRGRKAPRLADLHSRQFQS